MTIVHFLLLFVAAALGGALNSVAGGGTFITFPALIFAGIPPINANTTSTVALWPGSIASVGAYRGEVAWDRPVLLLGGMSVLGGVLGSVLLLRTPQATFEQLVPYLLLVATLLFTFGGPLTRRLGLGGRDWKSSSPRALLALSLAQLGIATYGGFFGGGIGVLMLAALSLMGMSNIHAMNALKTLFAACINAVAVLVFVAAGAVVWPAAAVMTGGALLGGYGGAYYARRVDPRHVRLVVTIVGCILTVYFFLTT
jgi:uncharacterized membrane protein YfcA